MEAIKYADIYEEMLVNSNTETVDLNSANRTLTNLKTLFKSSGCDEQICEIVEEKLPSTVEGGVLDSLISTFSICGIFSKYCLKSYKL